MGDTRFKQPFERVATASDRIAAMQSLTTEELLMAVAGAARPEDALVVNVLATEAINRTRRAEIVLESIGEGIIAVDAGRRVTYANPAALDLLGYERDEMLGTDLHALGHVGPTGDVIPEPECVVTASLATGKVTHRRAHGDSFRRKDGSTFMVELKSTPIERDDEVVGAVVVISDVTAQIEAELAIGRLAAIVEQSADPIITLATDGRITHANQAVEDLLGHERQTLLGKDVLDVIPPAETDRARALLEAVLQGDAMTQKDVMVRRRDGSNIVTSITVFPVLDSEKRVIAVSGVLRDVTTRRKEASRIARARARDKALQRTARYRLSTLLPALAWGFGTVILFRTILLAWFTFTPNDRGDILLLGTTTLALLAGLLVGFAVHAWKQRQAPDEHPDRVL